MERVPQIDYDDLAVQFLAQEHRTRRFEAWQKGMISGAVKVVNGFFENYCYGDFVSPVWSILNTYNLNDKVKNYNGVFVSTVNGNVGNNPDETPLYDPTLTYSIGFSVLFNQKYYILKTTISSPESFDPDKWTLITGSVWYKIAPSYLGAQERLQFSAQKLSMEFSLNRWFRVDFRQPTSLVDGSVTGKWYLPTSDIWIQTTNFDYVSFGVCTIPQTEGSVSSSPTIYGVCSTSITTTSTTYEYIIWIPIALSLSLGSSYIQIISEVANKMSVLGTSYTIQTY